MCMYMYCTSTYIDAVVDVHVHSIYMCALVGSVVEQVQGRSDT